jgi:hypothetical protein
MQQGRFNPKKQTMITRALTGKLSLGLAVFIVLGIGAKFALRRHYRNEERDQATMNRFAPALNRLSAENLVNSDWTYSGPLGELTLHFDADGKLTVRSSDQTLTGRWEIQDIMLKVHIPGADAPHQGIFRTSIDELSGPSPEGLEPKIWSAVRIK